jgi:hypothetical protein
MAKFDASKVMWTTEELDAGAAADEVWEAIALWKKEHPTWSVKDVPSLLLAVGKEYNKVFKVVNFLWKEQNLAYFADRTKDLLTMLERDNDFIKSRDFGE